MHTSENLQYPSSTSGTDTSPSSASQPWTPHDDSSTSTSDEEEVLFDLDESAMAELPIHLQHTMREIQRERVRRLSQGPENLMSMSVSVSMTMDMGMRNDSHSPVHSHNTYDRWVQNMMSRMSNDQEMSVAREARELEKDMHLNKESNAFGQDLRSAGVYVHGPGDEHSMEASSGRYYSRSISMSGRNVFLGCMGSFERNVLTRCTNGRQAVGGVLGDKFAAEHVSEVNVRVGGEMQQQRSRRGQFRKTILSAVRVRVKKSVQKMSMFFKK
ncbi:hypothetical protein P170DRAFT_434902 [Aspergillus steynii IBT 23096]|uniref:Uncharacterized protein n=1 Tax=Aspergillus steynii IBT 23096 TaxID=1392250 RepID=A0A2I2GK04_9EURO|nr:uncharacterized protein P170DRAFT_434902 [Aspergillus steynii IBT 23096]PLB53187.1 hypothetical protein P170DRAFT_434902 [Aspergillus steynii IBT 23096]